MTAANILDRHSIESVYPRDVWELEAANNSRGGQKILSGLLIESSPDDAGYFRIRRATRQSAEQEGTQRYVIFICPYMGKAYDVFTPIFGVHGAIKEKHDGMEPIDDEYADFIARVLIAASHAQLSHIPGHGEPLPKG
jgi:hypothetical protein